MHSTEESEGELSASLVEVEERPEERQSWYKITVVKYRVSECMRKKNGWK